MYLDNSNPLFIEITISCFLIPDSSVPLSLSPSNANVLISRLINADTNAEGIRKTNSVSVSSGGVICNVAVTLLS